MRYSSLLTTSLRQARRGMLAGSLAVVLALVAATNAQAASPSLGSITPSGAQRGTEVEVTFNGARLADAQEIRFFIRPASRSRASRRPTMP